MDTMTYLVHKTTDLPRHRIIGMGGALDSARFKYRLAEALGAPISDVDGMVIGGHSDTGMVPLTRLATRNSVPVTEFLSEERLNQVMEDTKVGGATLTKLLELLLGMLQEPQLVGWYRQSLVTRKRFSHVRPCFKMNMD